jgi:Transposase DDE domain group 1
MPSSHSPSRLGVAFDDAHAVATPGWSLPAVLAQHLGIEQLADELVDLGDRPGAAHPGRKVMTLLHALIAGGDCIDDAAVLRSGATASVLGHRVMAPSTLGTFLRAFTFGHVRQLDRLAELILAGAWAAGAGPATQPLTIDLDSTICQVYGHRKQGAAYGYTRVLGYHPLLATRADTGEVLHVRMRTGSANTARGAERFVEELAGRVRRAGARGPLTLRADSGFWSAKVMRACQRHRIRFSISVRQTKPLAAAIAAISQDAWTGIDYPNSGVAQVAETTLAQARLVVRRTRLVGAQATLWPDWRYHAFVTDRVGTTVELDADHRHHAVVELAVRDLKHGAGLRHCPSGKFLANAAWTVIAALAHNLLRWTATLGLGVRGLVVAKTLRQRFVALPGRLTRSAGRTTLHLPATWPWATGFLGALARLRTVPCPPQPTTASLRA